MDTDLVNGNILWPNSVGKESADQLLKVFTVDYIQF